MNLEHVVDTVRNVLETTEELFDILVRNELLRIHFIAYGIDPITIARIARVSYDRDSKVEDNIKVFVQRCKDLYNKRHLSVFEHNQVNLYVTLEDTKPAHYSGFADLPTAIRDGLKKLTQIKLSWLIDNIRQQIPGIQIHLGDAVRVSRANCAFSIRVTTNLRSLIAILNEYRIRNTYEPIHKRTYVVRKGLIPTFDAYFYTMLKLIGAYLLYYATFLDELAYSTTIEQILSDLDYLGHPELKDILFRQINTLIILPIDGPLNKFRNELNNHKNITVEQTLNNQDRITLGSVEYIFAQKWVFPVLLHRSSRDNPYNVDKCILYEPVASLMRYGEELDRTNTRYTNPENPDQSVYQTMFTVLHLSPVTNSSYRLLASEDRPKYKHTLKNVIVYELSTLFTEYENNNIDNTVHNIHVFRIKCPIYVARQWMRHRHGSYNELSRRYTDIKDTSDFVQLPFNYKSRLQDTIDINEHKNRQRYIKDIVYETCLDVYNDLKKKGLKKETARSILPLSLMTKFYWTVPEYSLENFLSLRTDKHAQLEIRLFANKIKEFSQINPECKFTSH